MAAYFLETSALVKRYIYEVGTLWMQNLTASNTGNLLYIAQIAGVEAVAAMTLRVRRGNTTAANAALAIADFRHDYTREYVGIQISNPLISDAMNLAETHGLRGYDTVQLAAALQVQAERIALGVAGVTFISADQALNAAAVAEGPAVDDPNLHP